MPSKYGLLKYSKGFYSRAGVYVYLEGSLPFTVDLAGRFGRSMVFQGTFSFGISGVSNLALMVSTLQGTFSFGVSGTAAAGISHPYSADLPFGVTFTGDLKEYEGLRGDVYIAPVLSGDLFRAAEREFRGNLDVQIDVSGSLGIAHPFEGELGFTIDVEGGAEVFIGPFWEPDVPIGPDWIPEPTVPYGWTPISVAGFNWTPDQPESWFWVPDVPVGPGWKQITPDRKWGT